MLPGETRPRPERTVAAIVCLRLRKPEESAAKKRSAGEAGLEERVGEEQDGEEGD
jgi:hypothetical protein